MNWQDYVMLAFLVMVCVAQCAVVVFGFKWLILEPSEDTETRCPTCGHSAQTAIEENTPMESHFKSPARRSLNPYREIRRLKQEVADAVACRDETQRLLEMQYVSMVEVVKAVNYMSTTGIAIQTKVGKA